MNEEMTIEIEEEELIYDVYTKEEFYEREIGRYMDRIAAEEV
jgi:hypothetical protein